MLCQKTHVSINQTEYILIRLNRFALHDIGEFCGYCMTINNRHFTARHRLIYIPLSILVLYTPYIRLCLNYYVIYLIFTAYKTSTMADNVQKFQTKLVEMVCCVLPKFSERKRSS